MRGSYNPFRIRALRYAPRTWSGFATAPMKVAAPMCSTDAVRIYGEPVSYDADGLPYIRVIFTNTKLAGACIVDLEPHGDDRGFFARAFCQREFEAHGLRTHIAQINIAFNRRKGTIRGLHFQFPPAAETKLVRCSHGAILDVIVDLRPWSPTYLQHAAVELTAENRRAVYVPERFAHGYQVLRDDTETTYYAGEFYTPGLESGLSYADPRLAIAWPLPPADVSPKDQMWGLLDQVEPALRARMETRG